MGCCTTEGTDLMFSAQARRYAKRLRKNGLDRAQRSILHVLENVGVMGKSILEVGCGVGGLHLTLVKKGAGSAVGVEISAGMIEEAKKLAMEFGVAERTSYRHGDLISANGGIPQSDIVILDKVLCCCPDPETLIEISAAKAGMLYAVSYPRNSWFAAIGFTIAQWVGTLFRWSFHPYYHRPARLDGMITQQGLQQVDAHTTPIWQVKLFRRKENMREGA